MSIVTLLEKTDGGTDLLGKCNIVRLDQNGARLVINQVHRRAADGEPDHEARMVHVTVSSINDLYSGSPPRVQMLRMFGLLFIILFRFPEGTKCAE